MLRSFQKCIGLVISKNFERKYICSEVTTLWRYRNECIIIIIIITNIVNLAKVCAVAAADRNQMPVKVYTQ